MAGCDYKHCDNCGKKAFYDAELNYRPASKDGSTPIRGSDLSLDYLGDWAVLCVECAKTKKCVIVEAT